MAKYTNEQRLAALQALHQNNGNFWKTANETGVPRSTLQRWAKGTNGQASGSNASGSKTGTIMRGGGTYSRAEGKKKAFSAIMEWFDELEDPAQKAAAARELVKHIKDDYGADLLALTVEEKRREVQADTRDFDAEKRELFEWLDKAICNDCKEKLKEAE
jgi:transposase-like protein